MLVYHLGGFSDPLFTIRSKSNKGLRVQDLGFAAHKPLLSAKDQTACIRGPGGRGSNRCVAAAPKVPGPLLLVNRKTLRLIPENL